MKIVHMAVAVALLDLGAARGGNSAKPAAQGTTPRSAPTVTVTQTKTVKPEVIATVVVPVTSAPQALAVTDPWAVVSAYYGDVESHNYPEAWAPLGSGMTTWQTYQQFVAGYACAGFRISQ
jgi:hypothetical protein